MVVASFVLVRIGIGVPQRPPSAGELGKQGPNAGIDAISADNEFCDP
jgi:hypothetical protein